MNAWQTISVAVLAYLVGSVSFAWLFAKKLKGVDLRAFGSGNLGATNAGRLLGRTMAVVIYVLDFAKGFVPVYLLRLPWGDPAAPGGVPVAVLAGLAALLGHCFPIWHGFRGGKGVATASGVIVALTPVVALMAFGAFGAVVLAARRISAASMAAAVSLPVAYAIFREKTTAASDWVLGLYAAIAVLVIARHHQNLRRLLRGEEPRIGTKKP
jgi:acyl phosphate:glycerol-3-phosphate acyltransferase